MGSNEVLTVNNMRLKADKIKTKEEAIKLAGSILVENGYVKPGYVKSMLQREDILSTYMGNYIAIPHGAEGSEGLINRTGISIVTLENEVNFGEDDKYSPVKLLFGISGLKEEHLEILSKIAIYISEENNVMKLIHSNDKSEILNVLQSVNL